MAFSDSAEELKYLQRRMSDLVSVLALPAVWNGQEPRKIVTTFHDALVATLSLDFLYTVARIEGNGEPIEVSSTAPHYATTQNADKIRQALNERFGDDPRKWPAEVRSRLGGQENSLLSMRLGIEGEIGIVVAGSERADFPTQSERLLLSVAANQVTAGLQQARLLSEQKRVASELDRRVAERTRELAQTNEELQLQVGLLQHLPVSTWTLMPDGTPDFVNRVWLEYSGQTLDFIRSHPEAWMTAVHPEDRETASRSFWDGVRSGQGFAFETRSLRAQDGNYRWHLNQAVALRDAEGKILKFVGTTTDIDDQKRAQEKLRASEANLRRVIDTIPSLSWCNLPDGPNEFLSKGWHDYTGMSPEEAHGWGWSASFHPDDLPPLMNRWQELLVSGEPGEIEARIRRHDGEYRWFLIRVAPFHDESGAILRWYGTSTDIHDRKLIDEALRASENNLRQILNSIPGLVCTMDPTGEIQHLNRPLLDYFGKTPEELRGWKMTDAVHPDDFPEVINSYTHSITTGAPYEIEHRCRRADGEYRWFQVRASAVRNPDGHITGWYVLLSDIDGRKRTEDELKRSEARHRIVVETASDAVVSIDENGLIILANPATKRIFGHNPEALIGKPLTVLMPGALRKFHEAGFNRYLETGVRQLNWQGTEVTALRANGEEFPAEVSFGEMAADQRKVFTGFIRDISEKKRAQEAIAASERNLSLIINTMPVLAWSALPDGAVEFFNKRWLDYTGLSPEQAQGWGWVEAVHPDDLAQMSGYWQPIIVSGRPGEIEARFRRFDNNYRWFLFRADPMRDKSGAIIKWYGTNTDIDDWKQAQQELRNTHAELARMTRVTTIAQLTASIAHEVNQPLSGIVTNASTCLRMLDSDPPNIGGARETARRTIRDGNRASEVVTRLRALFKRREVAAESIDLNDAAREVIALSLSELQSNRIMVRHVKGGVKVDHWGGAKGNH